MASEVIIHRLTPADWMLLKQVRLAALADTPLAFGVSLTDTEALTDLEWQQRAAGVSANGHPLVRFLAVQAGQPVGIMGVFLEPAEPVDGQPGDPDEVAAVPTLFTAWVDPALRGSTVADRLLGASRDWARATGADRMLLWVWTANHRARRFYERNGWRATGRSIPHVLDAAHTEIEYALTLWPARRQPDAAARPSIRT